MASTPGKNRSGASWLAIVLVVAIAIAAVFFIGGRNGNPFALSARIVGDTHVTGVIGSEKQAFFEDPAVQEIFADHDLVVDIDAEGSRRIATDVDLTAHDFAFVSSKSAGFKVSREHDNLGTTTPFSSPMAVATFTPILKLLEAEDVASRRGEHWVIDLPAFLELTDTGVRWRDLGDQYPSPRAVHISTTDIRSSNSAAMYLALQAHIRNGQGEVTAQAVPELVEEIAPHFVNQGHAESSSAGPFADYLSQGMGAMPMVMVYEAQYLGAVLSNDERLTDSMTLAYLSPTVVSDHTVVALSEAGAEVARLLAEDPDLQRLASAHGFRTNVPNDLDQQVAAAGLATPPLVIDAIELPSFDVLDSLIDGVGAHFPNPDTRTDRPENP